MAARISDPDRLQFQDFMRILASSEDLKALDPTNLTAQLIIKGVISDEDWQRVNRMESKSDRKMVCLIFDSYKISQVKT